MENASNPVLKTADMENAQAILDSAERAPFLSEQIITYLGNKRALLHFIGDAVQEVMRELGKEKLDIFDVFSGSGIVSRYFKQYSGKLYVNDLEDYCRTLNKCYLANECDVDMDALEAYFSQVQADIAQNWVFDGFISRLYAPKDDRNIQYGERVFYTTRNAQYIDTARQAIEKIPEPYKTYLLGPLLYGASVHTNTSGVFKGFYKNSRTGIGQYGGDGQNALKRILSDIELRLPIFSRFPCGVTVLQGDALRICESIPEVDLAYMDPPYNQHPYGSNYFMLNLINSYREPAEISRVSGIPTDWNKSPYNKKLTAKSEMQKLCQSIRAKYLLVSFNSEGFISSNEMIEMLSEFGEVKKMETQYNTFRGSRNLDNRDIHVKEFLFLVKKEGGGHMSNKDQLRGQRENMVINTISKREDKACERAVQRVIRSVRDEFGVEIKWEKRIKLVKIVQKLKALYPNLDFADPNDSSFMSPDGGITYLVDKCGSRYPILIAEVKNQGTNDFRTLEGKKKQPQGNAVERLGKNVIGFRTYMINEGIFPFVCFGDGCDFEEGSSILDRVVTIAMFGRLNTDHTVNEESAQLFNRGSYYFRVPYWSEDEMYEILLDVARKSVYYYFSKYGDSIFNTK